MISYSYAGSSSSRVLPLYGIGWVVQVPPCIHELIADYESSLRIMKALLAHCRNYRSEVKGLSNMPEGIEPESGENKITEASDAIVAFVTVEGEDDLERITPLLESEIRKMCKDTGHANIVLAPFAHLSSIVSRLCNGYRIFFAPANCLGRPTTETRALWFRQILTARCVRPSRQCPVSGVLTVRSPRSDVVTVHTSQKIYIPSHLMQGTV